MAIADPHTMHHDCTDSARPFMNHRRLEIPLAVQIGAVVILFAAAVGTLWYASTTVVARENRRARANQQLKEASNQLEIRGNAALARVRQFPDFMGAEDWAALERGLSDAARQILDDFPGIEGGYYVPARRGQPFLPPLPDQHTETGTDFIRKNMYRESLLQNLYDYVETQVDAAFRKKNVLSVVEDIPPYAIAIRAAPVRIEGRVVAATWTMTRLVDPIFLDRSARLYQVFAGLSLGGIALSLALCVGLARTVRRQAREREGLQTELRRKERLAALGKLLAGVAHEVRNPLAGIRSTVQLWLRGIGLDAIGLDGLVDEVDRLEEIVSRLLQFSRADAQDQESGDLNAVITEAAHLATGPAEAKRVRIELDLDSGLPPVTLAPPALLQVFRNLTTNAIQAMPEGGTLRLATRRNGDRKTVEASVADTGPGLSPDVLKHLFEPFYTTKPEGTGLGLAIAREIALAHRGELSVANRVDTTGAIFTLRLPVVPPASNGRTG
jgi:two-component system, NtrC family, sensor histidine kinase HydH